MSPAFVPVNRLDVRAPLIIRSFLISKFQYSPSWPKPSTSYASVVRGEPSSSDGDQDGKSQFAVSPPSWLQTFQTVGEDEAVKIALAESVLVIINFE